MNKKRHKLRLRKQVVICLPVLLIITFITLGFVINKMGIFSNEISKSQILKSNTYEGKKLSDLEYFKNLSEMIEKRQKDNTVIYYAQAFKLDVEKTLDLAHKYTNNYEDVEFNKTFVIGPNNIKSKVGSLKNFEAGVVYFVRDLYRYPERYGSSIEEIRTDETPTLKIKSSDGNIYMDNGLTFEQYIGKICDLFEVDKTTALAISYQESGIKTSNLFKNSNNIGGHRGYDGWMKYTTLEAGIIAHIISIKAMQDNYNLDLSTEEGLLSLSGIYVNGNISKPKYTWFEKVSIFKNRIEEKDLFTIKE